MSESERIILSWDTGAIAAFLYLHLGEQMPHDPYTYDDNGRIIEQFPGQIAKEEAKFEEWALSPGRPEAIGVTLHMVERFVNDLQILVDDLQLSQPEDYMTHFYDAAKRTFNDDKKKIRTWFTWLYLIIFERIEGPRWGEFVQIYGVENFAERLRRRLFNLSYGSYRY